MQPCAVCGGIGIDASGYCVNCRTYQGASGQTQTSGYRPISGGPYQSPAAQSSYPSSTASYPSSVVPYSPNADRYTDPYADRYVVNSPFSGQGNPYQPEYPSGGDLAPHRHRGPLAVPLVALSTTLVLLVVAIIVVMIFRDKGTTKAALVDSCVVGSWTVMNMTMDVSTENFGIVHFTNVGSVGKVNYTSDGKAVHDYGDNTQFVADVTDAAVTKKVNLKVTGVAKFDFRTANSTMSFSNAQANGKTTLTVVATGAASSTALDVSTDPAKYSCQGDTMTVYTENYRAESHRDG